MRLFRRPSSAPLWRDEFSVFTADERYVNRRQFTKFLTLTSFAMLAGNLWILARSIFYRAPSYRARAIAALDEIPVGGVKLFAFPTARDPCILVRTGAESYAAFSQKCTHLSCAVIPDVPNGVIRCPCHDGVFDLASGRPLAGPPRRPLSLVTLDIRDGDVFATGVEERTV